MFRPLPPLTVFGTFDKPIGMFTMFGDVFVFVSLRLYCAAEQFNSIAHKCVLDHCYSIHKNVVRMISRALVRNGRI